MFYMGSWELRDYTTPSVNKIGANNVGFFPFPNVVGGVGSSTQTPMNAGQPTSVNKAKYNATIGQWLANMAKNYGDVALQKEGAVTGFVVHNKPANAGPADHVGPGSDRKGFAAGAVVRSGVFDEGDQHLATGCVSAGDWGHVPQ